MTQSISIAFVHLGCEKNRVDTEHMMGLVAQAGIAIALEPEQANYVIVNTCSFIESAREESVNTIVALEKSKKRVIITGCMAQHFKNELLKEFPTAHAVVGTGDYHNILEIINAVERGERVIRISDTPDYLADETVPRTRPAGSPTAWVRIAEGCDCRCSFCIIPQLRGKQRSRNIQSVVSEVSKLVAEGVQEVILVAQNSTSWGTDLPDSPRFESLVEAVAATGIYWIRIHYAYPTGITDGLLRVMRSCNSILPYFDIPFQHSHKEILKAMNRPWQQDSNERVINRIRDLFPKSAIRTTFIVGFPGERPHHFEQLLKFVERTRFDHVGVFCYSPEPDTPAYNLPGRVSDKTKQKRQDAIMSLQQTISAERNRAEIGTYQDILIERNDPEQPGRLIGRSYRYSPEVDGVIYVEGTARIGSIVRARITDADIYDQYAEIEPS